MSAPLAWHELEAACASGDEAGLWLGPAQVLARVERAGDPFSDVPALSCIADGGA